MLCKFVFVWVMYTFYFVWFLLLFICQSAVGFEHHEDLAKHNSQQGDEYNMFCHFNEEISYFSHVRLYLWVLYNLKTFLPARLDYSKGFGGKFGVQSDRQDKVSTCYTWI